MKNLVKVTDKQFGAKGDGVTDDTLSLQAAINYAFSNGKKVYIPKGVFITSKSLMVKKGVSIIGDGVENTIIKKVTNNSVNRDVINIKGGNYRVDNDSILNIENGSINFTIENLALYSGTYDEVSANLENNKTLTKHGIYCLMSGQFTIRNVLVRGCGEGFYFLSPWKANFKNCKAMYSDRCFYMGFHPNSSGTTTLLENCYSLVCSVGFHIAGMGTCTLKLCSVDWGQRTAYNLSLCKQTTMESCSVEQSSNIILRLSGCSNVKVSTLSASGVIAKSPFTYVEAPIYLGTGDAIFENITIHDLVNDDGTPYANTKDIHNMSIQSGNNHPFNYKFINCRLPKNAKPAFVNGDTSAKSSVEFINADGSKNLYSGISNVTHSLSSPVGVESYSNTFPNTGTHRVNEIIWNTSPIPGGYIGWVCVQGGSPGVWKGFGVIEV